MSSPERGDVGRSQSLAHRLLQTNQPPRQLKTSLTQSPLSTQNTEVPVCMIMTATHAPLIAGSSGARGGRRHDRWLEGRTRLLAAQSPSTKLNPHVMYTQRQISQY